MMAEEAGLESFEHAILRLEAALQYDPEGALPDSYK